MVLFRLYSTICSKQIDIISGKLWIGYVLIIELYLKIKGNNKLPSAYVWLQHQILTHMAEEMSISSDTLMHFAEYAVTVTGEAKRNLRLLYRLARGWFSRSSKCRRWRSVPMPLGLF